MNNNHYELVFLVHPDHSEQVSAMVDRYRNLIESNGGKIHRQEDWGRRQLAYPINNSNIGHYLLINFECRPDILNELTHNLRYNDAVLRHLVLQRKAAITEPSVMLRIKEKEEKIRTANQTAPEKSTPQPEEQTEPAVEETTTEEIKEFLDENETAADENAAEETKGVTTITDTDTETGEQ